MTATLSIGCTFSDRIEALLDGRVTIEGFTTDLHIVEPQRLFREILRDARYDVAELSMGSHIAAIAAGRRDYVGVPVFLSRSFRHSNLYIRTDREIERPEDLTGRVIGLIDYQQTAALWLRGILADDYGVARDSIRWVAAGLHTSITDDRTPMTLPAGIRVERTADTLDALLVAGEIDAVISPSAPRSFLQQTAPVARLWRYPREVERDYWRRSALFPIMHVLVVRRTLFESRPELAEVIFAAFDAARAIAAADLTSRDFPKLTLPWLNDHASTVCEALNGDPWTYGLEANRKVLEKMLHYAKADGFSTTLLKPEDLFS